MTRAHQLTIAAAATWSLSLSASAAAQSDDTPVELLVRAGTPLRVALDETTALKRVGQVVSGTLAEPLYAYDRMVLPVGSQVTGHVSALEPSSKQTQLRAWL